MTTPDQEQQGDQRSVRTDHRTGGHRHSPPPVNYLQRYLIFAAAILVTGVVAGVMGASTTLLLRAIEHVTYGYTGGPMLAGVRLAPTMRRLMGPALGCALAGLGWWLLRRNTAVPPLNDSIRHDRPFAQVPMTLDALLQVLAVGTGASLGREQAPRLFAAAGTEMLIRLGSIPLPHRRILLASAAGAGLAAVYNVPAAGALFAVGIILRSWRPVAVLVAVATSCIATVTAWPISHGAATFQWPPTHFTRASFAFAIVAMPFAALTGTSFNALLRRARKKATPSWLLIPAIGLAGLLTGTSSIWLPQMPGNGKDIILESLAGGGTLAGAALALALKPALTALFIRVGAVGGMLTPALATGVAMGSVFALTINHLGGHASVPTLALIGGAAVLGITQRAPVFATVFTAELTHPPSQVWVMLLVAALGAQGVRVMAMRRQAARALRSVQMRTVSRNSSRRRLIGNRASAL
ncbi:MAG: chloride channel protein [Mycobacterium sp.]|uniref:chloride channel protein n=1 Tax=Mycobacterium sp. TaxID=1785 RepID=UPI003F9E630D